MLLDSGARAGSPLRVNKILVSLLRMAVFAVIPFVASCDSCAESDGAPDPSASGSAASTGGKAPASDGVTLTLVYGSEKKTWIEEEAKAFEASGAKTAKGQNIHVDAKAMGSGEALTAIVEQTTKADIFSPASSVYLSLLNDKWQAGGNAKPVVGKGEPLVLSPVVIAMWKPMATALGWPKKQLSVERSPQSECRPEGLGRGRISGVGEVQVRALPS